MPPHGSSTEEPCRSCTSFAEYMRRNKKKYRADMEKDSSKEKPEETPVPMRSDCPPDKDVLGSSTWTLLHSMAAKYPPNPSNEQKTDMRQFFHIFSKFYPCEHCAEDFREELKTCPPKTDSQEALSQWLCVMHNRVNTKLGKPVFDCTKVNERWRDGWLDGSCD